MSNFNPPSRKIYVFGVITDEMANEVTERIMEINDYDNYMRDNVKNYEEQPIQMFINSNGGVVTAGFTIIGAMELSRTPIISYALGMIASMALAIFVSADLRIAHRYSRFMYHPVSYGEIGTITDHEKKLDEAKILQDMYNSVFEGTDLTKELMDEIINRNIDFFFSANYATKLGIAHEVTLKPKADVGEEEQGE